MVVQFIKDLSKGFDGKLNKKNRLLHERSHLALEFPQSDNRVIRTFIPILENPQVSERGAANLNNYTLVGRAGELFSYAGAKSRRINLTFNISLLHVIEMNTTEGITEKFKRQFKLFFTEREDARELFNMREEARINRENLIEAGLQEEGTFTLEDRDAMAAADDFLGDTDQKINGKGRAYASTHRDYYRKLIGELTGAQLEVEESESFLAPVLDALDIETASQGFKDLNDTIDLVYCWVNLIRGSVLNNSSNTLYGPPILRLTHGPMYNNIPCLVENYNIRIVDEAGYDVQTLTPRKIEVSLSLIESRTGNFGKYQATQIENGDNITGWESIIGNNDLDPQNGLISRENGFR
ncbi:hypothetical protein [Phenylobacterium sp.]|uniref:hypothetical protein n=1 Tax=Phenylobacterium sp. TaxID=1871053 RepID=UPI0025D13E4D|nr:hypothetical protein [Phenylobacterium sp.]